MAKGMLFTVSAPSGAGKTSLVRALIEHDSSVVLSISHTTRPKRPGEVDGVDYHFVSKDEFHRLAEEGAFLEHAEVFGNYYGTTQSSVESALAEGKSVLLEIDWQGAAQVRRLVPESVSIFILPPSRKVLEDRLRGRAQDSEAVIARRMAAARNEISHYAEADFIVINDEFERALSDMLAIIRGEILKQQKQDTDVTALISALLAH